MRDMTKSELEEFDRIFELPTNPLGTVMKDFSNTVITGYLEITLNHPNTAFWERQTDDFKRAMYTVLLDRVIENCGIQKYIKEKSISYEYGKESKKLHLHALLCMEIDCCFNPYGLVEDAARKWLNCLPKRYSKYDEKYSYKLWPRYCCPSICVQFNKEIERKDFWTEYIFKDM